MKPVTFSMLSATRGLACISSKSESTGGASMRGIWMVGGSANAVLASKAGSVTTAPKHNRPIICRLNAGFIDYGDLASTNPAANDYTLYPRLPRIR